jgi:hypothetical protein
MQIQNTKNGYILLAVAAVLVLLGIGILFIWGSGNKAAPTATISVNDIYTQVAQTVIAQQATQQALNPPTTTPFPTLPALPTVGTQAAIPTALLIVSPTTAANSGCDNAVYVNDVTIPDNTIMSPGQTFIKTWLIQNNGTCTWDTNYKFAFASGDIMSGVSTAMTQSVAPGQQIEISVNLTAPTQPGTYKGYWRMINNSGVFFGDSPWVLIQVANATTTNTSAPPTDTPTATATATH